LRIGDQSEKKTCIELLLVFTYDTKSAKSTKNHHIKPHKVSHTGS
jgi:hypothetical protein